MSYKYGSALVPGAYHYGSGGLGVLGSAVPSTGLHGPSYLFNDLVLPADAGKEVRGLITRWPTLGVFTPAEDGSFTYVGVSDYAVYQLIVDGAVSTTDIGFGPGLARITFIVEGAGVLLGDAVLGNLITNGGFVSFGPSALSGEVTLDGLGASGGFYGDQPVNLSQDYPGWVVRAYINGGQWWRP